MDECTETLSGPDAPPTEHDEPARLLSLLWRQGPPPDVRKFLGDLGELSPVQLAALLRVDQRERWRIGQPISASCYLRDHPALQADPEAALEVIYNEFLLREDRGETPSLDEYLRRFPDYAARLREQVELHQALGSRSRIDPDQDPEMIGPVGPPWPGRRWPTVTGYEILGELGRGGMGMVYEARQVELKRPVALKMIRAGAYANAEELERFRLEARAVASLQHPNIVQIYEIGEQDGQPFFSLEHAPGGSLADRLAGTPQPSPPAARVVRTLALAVQAAHDRGIVHRDLKPANVLLMADGTPKISDFGLAKLLDSEARLSRSGEIKGTPCYMAPEQAAGHPNGSALDQPTEVPSLELNCHRPAIETRFRFDRGRSRSLRADPPG